MLLSLINSSNTYLLGCSFMNYSLIISTPTSKAFTSLSVSYSYKLTL